MRPPARFLLLLNHMFTWARLMPVCMASFCLSKQLGLWLLSKWAFSTEIAAAVWFRIRVLECTGAKHAACVCLGKDLQCSAVSGLDKMVGCAGAHEIINTVSSGKCDASLWSSAYMIWVVSSIIIDTPLTSAKIESSATPTFHSTILGPVLSACDDRLNPCAYIDIVRNRDSWFTGKTDTVAVYGTETT